MLQKIRYGIIGCGSMGREHILNIMAMDACVVTALADVDAGSRDRHKRCCWAQPRSPWFLSGLQIC